VIVPARLNSDPGCKNAEMYSWHGSVSNGSSSPVQSSPVCGLHLFSVEILNTRTNQCFEECDADILFVSGDGTPLFGQRARSRLSFFFCRVFKSLTKVHGAQGSQANSSTDARFDSIGHFEQQTGVCDAEDTSVAVNSSHW
jgi:hypothetical protein